MNKQPHYIYRARFITYIKITICKPQSLEITLCINCEWLN